MPTLEAVMSFSSPAVLNRGLRDVRPVRLGDQVDRQMSNGAALGIRSGWAAHEHFGDA
jgi:hypothetical protein